MESFEEVYKGSEDDAVSVEGVSLLSSEKFQETFENEVDNETINHKRKVENDFDDINNDQEENNDNHSKGIKISRKRRTKQEENIPFYMINEIFLRILYPLSVCTNKNITIGICKFFNYKPGVLLNHGGKWIKFIEDSWVSLNRCIPLIHCYLTNKVYGKKTSISIEHSDIIVDNIKVRGELCVRFRNVSSYDEKILLSINEFEILINTVPAIDRYIQQLQESGTTIKDYLLNTIEKSHDTPLFYGALDNSIYNRLPQEVFLFRNIKSPNCQNEASEHEQMFILTEDEPLIKFEHKEGEQPTDLSKKHASEADN